MRKTKKYRIKLIWLMGPVWLLIGLYPLFINSSLQIVNYLELTLGVGLSLFLIFDRYQD
ncbi:hypothetical protein SAMN06297358_4182 [Pedobacter xixiisoli]|uniref:Uncharacterized protein n=1 Tax=Pedobacter xixiisoli TaxID=1476464 RepID=A0A286AEY2_9SPHI|nr:hypothetical protein SAMN06297358_4182 [Pedobacter xixiisoli]